MKGIFQPHSLKALTENASAFYSAIEHGEHGNFYKNQGGKIL